MAETQKTAIVLLGHGSRVAGAGEGMERVAERLRANPDHAIVEICYQSMQAPTFGEALDKCVEQGAGKVVVIPYFLHLGAHLRDDLPVLFCQAAEKYPDLALLQGEHLGYDPLLVDLVEKRIGEAEGRA